MNRNIYAILILLLLGFVGSLEASAQEPAERAALAHLSGIKAYFDIKADSAAKVEKRLVWINDIYQQMEQGERKAAFVIGFRSQASFFVTRGDEDLEEEDLAAKRKIEKWLKRFVAVGIRLEQCGLSAELYNIDPQDFLPEITVVKNGYISMIGYQNKGYAYVPM